MDGAQDFDGSNDYVGIANESNFDFEWSNPFSVSAWIRPDSTALASQTIAAKMESPPNRGWTLDLFDPSSGSDAVTFQLVNVESGSPIQIDVRSPSGVIEAGGLYHVVATYNGNGLASGVAIHINGVSQALTVVHDNLSGNTTLNDFEPRIGKRTDNSWPFDGLIDEVRVSNVSRSPSWIQTEYNNQASPSTFMSFGIEEDQDRGVTPTGRSDTMSDSRTSEPSNHTLSFSVNSAVEASQSLEFTWPEGFSFTGGDSWYSNDWGFRKEIEIDKNKVAGAATSFPVLINSTLWEWKHTSSGGHVGNTSGWDFLFTGSDGTTKLDHEIEKYASSTGELIAWVDVPFLSSTS
ncbi:MAG: LamG domain-containing protein, partial [bacterium]|nr:LamG domain-containing protein [bacterium]